MDRERKEAFLGAGDDTLNPLGFTRRAKTQEWSKVAGSDRVWLHLNFGKALVNATFGVEYTDLKSDWPLSGGVYGTMRVLGAQFEPPRSYVSDQGPDQLFRDVVAMSPDSGFALRDRAEVVTQLLTGAPKRWPVAGLAFRARLVPILLCSLGKVPEALEVLALFEEQMKRSDQLVPSYAVFAAEFRLRLAA